MTYIGSIRGAGRLAIAVVVVGCVMASTVQATPIPITLTGANFSTLLTGAVTPIGSGPMISPMSQDNLVATVYSQAFKDSQNHYLYLYQVKNTGGSTNEAIEAFACRPFAGLTTSAVVGYLTANAPTGFTLGDQGPAGASVNVASGPTLSFGFPAWTAPDKSINPGMSSYTLFVLSNTADGLITGNVQDGANAYGDIIGPVPEPAAMSLLLLGAGLVLRRRRAKA